MDIASVLWQGEAQAGAVLMGFVSRRRRAAKAKLRNCLKLFRWVQDKAKIGENAQFTVVKEHFEPIFNTVLCQLRGFKKGDQLLRATLSNRV